MACTCRTALAALRQPTHSFSRSPVALRQFSSSPISRSASAPTPAKNQVESSVKAGTVFTGLNYLKDGTDPVAKEDSEYPAWVWTLAEKEGSSKTKGSESEAERLQAARKQLKASRKAAIKAANTLKG